MKRVKKLAYWVLAKPIRRWGHLLIEEFALSEFKQDFKKWLSRSASHKSKKRVKLSIDLSKTGRKYGKQIPELEKLYDYVESCYINTHEIAILLVSIGGKDYVLDFVLLKKKNRHGVNKLAKKMINRFL